MEICATDLRTIVRYLEDAAAFYRRRASLARERDRARLIMRLTRKLKRKIPADKATLPM